MTGQGGGQTEQVCRVCLRLANTDCLVQFGLKVKIVLIFPQSLLKLMKDELTDKRVICQFRSAFTAENEFSSNITEIFHILHLVDFDQITKLIYHFTILKSEKIC